MEAGWGGAGPQVCGFETLAPRPQRGRQWNPSKWHFLLPPLAQPGLLREPPPGSMEAQEKRSQGGWSGSSLPQSWESPGFRHYPVQDSERVASAGAPPKEEDLPAREIELDLR